MSEGGLAVGVVMLLIGVGWLALPFLRARSGKNALEKARERERLTLIAAYERALQAARDLDEDYQVGKLTEDAYSTERARWVEQGAALLAALEDSGTTPKPASKQVKQADTEVSDTDDAVEKAIAAYAQARNHAAEGS